MHCFACRVRLLVHAGSGAAVALKAVRAEGEAAGACREAALHRALRHPHVLRCLGERTHQGLHYMFLEYAQGGELFDRIGEGDARARPPRARAPRPRARAHGPPLRRARRGHGRGGGAALLAAAAGRPRVPARPRRGAPRHQARELAARPQR